MSSNQLPLEEKRENIFYDTRRLVIIDSNNILNEKNNEKELTETIMINKAKQNYISFASTLFDLLLKQQGKEKEDLDYDKAPDELTLPEAILTLPRSLPIPVAKPLTKWEKYKKEKGITQRKRARMVYSEEVGDWVPRWGLGSVKKIQDSMNWVMEEKITNGYDIIFSINEIGSYNLEINANIDKGNSYTRIVDIKLDCNTAPSIKKFILNLLQILTKMMI